MTIRKRKADPKLTAPNSFMRQQMCLTHEDYATLQARRLESLVCEQYWLIREAPKTFIRNQRDEDGYLLLQGNMDFPMPLLLDPDKILSLADCIEKPVPKLLCYVLADEDRILGVTRSSGGSGTYAQIGIFKSPEDELAGPITGPLIKRGYDGHVYYMGRVYDLLLAMREVEIISLWEECEDT